MSTLPTRNGALRWSMAVLVMATIARAQTTEPPKEITLLVPGSAGGGWDLTARTMKSALESEGLARVRIEMSPGPGGSVGLAQLLSGHRGDGRTLLVGGLVMLSAAASQHLAISPLDTTAVARLTGDYPIVVVPSSSPYQTMADLMAAVKADTSGFPWAGGSSGSLYERLAGDLYEAGGLSRSSLNYVPYGSGRDVAESLLNGRVRVGVSESAEIEPYLTQGRLRSLAVAAPNRIPELKIPTLRESGYDVVAPNWRGVFAGPGLARSDQDQLEALISKMVESRAWKHAIARRRWTNLYLGAIPFRDFLESEYSRWSVPPRSTRLPSVPNRADEGSRWVSPGVLAFMVLVLFLLGGGALAWRLRARRFARLPEPISPPLGAEVAGRAAPAPPPHGAEANDLTAGGVAMDGGPENPTSEPDAVDQAVKPDEIAQAFDTWKLTAAERDIAELMLQGLRYKQIAGHRGTSERTVRQQAQVILKKAGLDGRADLAAYFLQRRAGPQT